MLSLLFFSVAYSAPPAGYHPVVIAGPFMGQNLEVKNQNLFTICNTKGEYEFLWPKLEGIDDFYCISEGLKLGGWDDVKKVSIPKDNVHVRPFGYAGSERDQLDGLSFGDAGEASEYPLIPALKKVGYEVGTSLFGHTFDWRLSMRNWELQYFPVFKTMIEDAVAKANGAGAVLTGISMAGQYCHGFISWARREHGDDWVTENIHAFAPVATGWNGAVMALAATLDSVLGTWRTDGECPNCSTERRRFTGLTDYLKGVATEVGDDLLKDVFSSFPSMYTVSPGIDHSTNPPTDHEVVTIRNAQAAPECIANSKTAAVCGAKEDASGYNFPTGFLAQDQCGECMWSSNGCPSGFDRAYDGWTADLCCKRHQCGSRTYRATEIPELFRELGKEDQARMLEYALTVDTTSDPGVPVHCIYSHNVQTFNGLNLALNKADKDLEGNFLTMDDGDQTVDHNSLEVCSRWASTIKSYKIPGVAHSSMLSTEQSIEVIIAVAMEDQATLDAWTPPKYDEVRPKSVKVSPAVLLKREGYCYICESLAELNADATYMDPNTKKETKCADADNYCSSNDCGDLTELRTFFKEQTDCCNKATFDPKLWRLQKATE